MNDDERFMEELWEWRRNSRIEQYVDQLLKEPRPKNLTAKNPAFEPLGVESTSDR